MKKYNEYIVEKISKVEEPIVAAAKRGSSTLIKSLIKSGANINARSRISDGVNNGRTALMFAVMESYISVVTELVDAGADVNMQDQEGSTALMMASTGKIVDKLLEGDPDVNKRDRFGDTAIMIYLSKAFFTTSVAEGILNKFLDRGLDLDIKNNKGENFYEKIKWIESIRPIPTPVGGSNWLQRLENYMNENFPKYKDEWDLQNNIRKYNL